MIGPQPSRAAPTRRALVMKLVFIVIFVVVALRLVQIQVIQAPVYQEIARKQHEARVVLPAARGTMSDRNGKLLVSNTAYVTFGADPKLLGARRDAVATLFARTFGRPAEFYRSRLEDGSRRFVFLERSVKPAYAKQIATRTIEGLVAMEEPERLYHYDHMGAQLLGITGVDHTGLCGLELQLDKELRGKDGYVILQRDARRNIRPTVDYPRIDPVHGHSVTLTLDIAYQAIVEEELRKGVDRSGADAGVAILLDPHTGEILALANVPSFNPNATAVVDQAHLRNRVITDVFEPGSIFKLVTVTAALEQGVIKTGDRYFAENGTYRVPLPGGGSRTVTDVHRYGMLTFQEAVEVSSNIVMVKVAPKIGAGPLFETARAFGFGNKTGVDLAGEVEGELKLPTAWSATTLSAVAIGYEVAVTPLQVAMAFAAVANGGKLYKPYVVRSIVNQNNETVYEGSPRKIRTVMTEKTTRALTAMLEGVVERGTGIAAKVPGLRVAGKTGTSRTVVGGKYESGNYTASFAGFFPADAPQFVCLVKLDRPRAGSYYGGQASAPIFKAIAEKVYGLAQRLRPQSPPLQVKSGGVFVPDVVNVRVDDARTILEEHGFVVRTAGEGPVVLAQTPTPGTRLPRGSDVRLTTVDAARSVPAGYTLVPDLRGLTMRRAINRLSLEQLDVSISGTGRVVTQSPSPGQAVRVGSLILVRCEPPIAAFAGL